MVGADGSVYSFGATYVGSPAGTHLHAPIVGISSTPLFGYWLVASDGGVFGYGDARFFGSAGAVHLHAPVVGMAATPTGRGYWLVASDGGVFGYGDAWFFGSAGAVRLNRPVVGMAATPTGRGYWLVASDGGVFGYGDARFFGSAGAVRLNSPVVGMTATPTGRGYWLAASDGGVFGYGDAWFFGSAGAVRLNRPVVGMAATPTGAGYWLVASDGGVFGYGDAHFHGSAGAAPLPAPVVGMSAQRILDPYRPGTTGYDISWPQCGGAYPPPPHDITIVGVNRGRMYTKNPCLASEAAWAGPSLTLYVNVDGLPNDTTSGLTGPRGTCAVTDLSCRSYNYGRNAATFDLTYTSGLGIGSSMWWLDVEIGKPWRSDNLVYNVEVIKGMLDGLREHGNIVGIYSTSYQWGVITGGGYYPGTPIWVPGARDATEAKAHCAGSYSFGGGTTWLTQWTITYDHDYACDVTG